MLIQSVSLDGLADASIVPDGTDYCHQAFWCEMNLSETSVRYQLVQPNYQ
jgi:hypothetical protein